MTKLLALASVLALGGSLGAAALSASSAPSFAPARSYATGRTPQSVAINDLNGDGKPDLATANGTVSVLLNRGDGSFQAKRDYATTGAISVAIGDLNGDGKLDLATANLGANTVSVLLNRGDGTYDTKHDYATGRGPLAVVIGDLNGDGRPDVATANLAFSVSVLLNRGDGSFRAKLDYGTRRAESVAIGDLNGDGKPDLATANRASNTVSVLINTPGLCAVQNVEEPGMTLPAAKRTIARVHCRVGELRRAYSKEVKRGHVISQKPKPGTVLIGGGKVTLVVSRGRRPS